MRARCPYLMHQADCSNAAYRQSNRYLFTCNMKSGDVELILTRAIRFPCHKKPTAQIAAIAGCQAEVIRGSLVAL